MRCALRAREYTPSEETVVRAIAEMSRRGTSVFSFVPRIAKVAVLAQGKEVLRDISVSFRSVKRILRRMSWHCKLPVAFQPFLRGPGEGYVHLFIEGEEYVLVVDDFSHAERADEIKCRFFVPKPDN